MSAVVEEKKSYIGSSLEDFLKAEGIFEEVDENAVKRVMTWQIEQEMKKQGLTTAAVAAKMHTSRASLKRTLDPQNTSVTLNTLIKIAQVLGKQLKIELV